MEQGGGDLVGIRQREEELGDGWPYCCPAGEQSGGGFFSDDTLGLIQALGEKGPEWELEDVSLKEELHGLSTEVDDEEVEVAVEVGWQGLLDRWVIGKPEEEPTKRTASPALNSDGVNIERLNKMNLTKEMDNTRTEEEDLDSDDDDLPAFDMSNDTPVTEETKVSLKTRLLKIFKTISAL